MIDRPEFEDRVITCVDCKEDFTFTTGEQEFFWSKGLAEPKRCKLCRILRQRTINGQTEVHNGKSNR